MANKSLVILYIGFTAATLASAQSSDPVSPPRLAFRTIPVEGVLSNEHKVTPYRLNDMLIVTVWDPVACGQKPHDESVSIKGNSIFLSYSLSERREGAAACTLVSEFEVFNVPNRDLTVHFAGGTEPYVIARMKKCPNYKPSGADIWECLMPEKN